MRFPRPAARITPMKGTANSAASPRRRDRNVVDQPRTPDPNRGDEEPAAREPWERLEAPRIDQPDVIDPVGLGLADQRASRRGHDGGRLPASGDGRLLPG